MKKEKPFFLSLSRSHSRWTSVIRFCVARNIPSLFQGLPVGRVSRVCVCVCARMISARQRSSDFCILDLFMRSRSVRPVVAWNLATGKLENWASQRETKSQALSHTQCNHDNTGDKLNKLYYYFIVSDFHAILVFRCASGHYATVASCHCWNAPSTLPNLINAWQRAKARCATSFVCHCR